MPAKDIHKAQEGAFRSALQVGSEILIQTMIDQNGAWPYALICAEMTEDDEVFRNLLDNGSDALLNFLKRKRILTQANKAAALRYAIRRDSHRLLAIGTDLDLDIRPLCSIIDISFIAAHCGPALAPILATDIRTASPETILALAPILATDIRTASPNSRCLSPKAARAIALAHPDTPINHAHPSIPDDEARSILRDTHSAHGRARNRALKHLLAAFLVSGDAALDATTGKRAQ